MARIRTVKPELFRHEILFELEQETGLPIRLAWIALFTVADRQGRFKWRPKSLKLDVLPYDDIDFADVLNALHRGKLIIKYQVGEEMYGCIPNWSHHQVINTREAQSTIPSPDSDGASMCMHVHACAEPVHAQGEGKGREGKGIYIGLLPNPDSQEFETETEPEPMPQFDKFNFEAVYEAYPKRHGNQGKGKGIESLRKKVRHREDYDKLLVAVTNYATYCKNTQKTGTEFVMQFQNFVKKSWDEWITVDPNKDGTIDWDRVFSMGSGK